MSSAAVVIGTIRVKMVKNILKFICSSPGLCPWRAYVVIQSLALASVHIHFRGSPPLNTVFSLSFCLGQGQVILSDLQLRLSFETCR